MAVFALVNVAACAAPPGQALSVGGLAVSERDFEVALDEFGSQVLGTSTTTAASFASGLILAEVFDQALEQIGGPAVTDEEATDLLNRYREMGNESRASQGLEPLPQVESYSQLVLQVVHVDVISERLQIASELGVSDLDYDALLAALGELLPTVEVKVNPRFGQWDPQAGSIGTASFPWSVSASAPTSGGVLTE
ncbi:MAG: hypothetical protein LBJ08_03855 [Bifidobacteriaceae bacterium]|nr:hypothetical protein [Bifidobacteriaceae bacterium]